MQNDGPGKWFCARKIYDGYSLPTIATTETHRDAEIQTPFLIWTEDAFWTFSRLKSSLQRQRQRVVAPHIWCANVQCQWSEGSPHTSYLSFLLLRQDFRKPNFTPKKTTKGTKNTKNVSEKVKYMHFFHSIWKNLHLTENFYTDTVCGVCDKYEVWVTQC